MPNATKPADAIPTEPEELRKFLKRAHEGDASTLPVLRKMLETPACVDSFGGNLAWQAERSLIEAAGGKNLAFKEALARKLELLRAELAGPDPAPLERLLVERVVSCWLHLNYLEVGYAQQDGMALTLGTYYQLCLDRAQRRYLAAIKTLALVRKLALPALTAPKAPPRAAQAPPPTPASAPTPAPAAAPTLPAALAARLADGPGVQRQHLVPVRPLPGACEPRNGRQPALGRDDEPLVERALDELAARQAGRRVGVEVANEGRIARPRHDEALVRRGELVDGRRRAAREHRRGRRRGHRDREHYQGTDDGDDQPRRLRCPCRT